MTDSRSQWERLRTRLRQLWTEEVPRLQDGEPGGFLELAPFLRRGSALLGGARRARQPLTLAVLRVDDLARVEQEQGVVMARRLRRTLAARLLAAAGRHGLVGGLSPSEYVLALPGQDEDNAWRLLRGELGTLPDLRLRLRDAAGRGEVVALRVLCLTRCVEADHRPLASWLEELREDSGLAVRWNREDSLAVA